MGWGRSEEVQFGLDFVLSTKWVKLTLSHSQRTLQSTHRVTKEDTTFARCKSCENGRCSLSVLILQITMSQMQLWEENRIVANCCWDISELEQRAAKYAAAFEKRKQLKIKPAAVHIWQKTKFRTHFIRLSTVLLVKSRSSLPRPKWPSQKGQTRRKAIENSCLVREIREVFLDDFPEADVRNGTLSWAFRTAMTGLLTCLHKFWLMDSTTSATRQMQHYEGTFETLIWTWTCQRKPPPSHLRQSEPIQWPCSRKTNR